jgi:hypothetical protein
VDIALAPAPKELKSFRLAQPVAGAASHAEFTVCTLLSLAATGLWLLVLPLELLRLSGV